MQSKVIVLLALVILLSLLVFPVFSDEEESGILSGQPEPWHDNGALNIGPSESIGPPVEGPGAPDGLGESIGPPFVPWFGIILGDENEFFLLMPGWFMNWPWEQAPGEPMGPPGTPAVGPDKPKDPPNDRSEAPAVRPAEPWDSPEDWNVIPAPAESFPKDEIGASAISELLVLLGDEPGASAISDLLDILGEVPDAPAPALNVT